MIFTIFKQFDLKLYKKKKSNNNVLNVALLGNSYKNQNIELELYFNRSNQANLNPPIKHLLFQVTLILKISGIVLEHTYNNIN